MCKKEVGVIDIHHIKPVSEGGLSTYPNLISLCPNCHRLTHKYEISAKSLKRLRDTWVQVCRAERDALGVIKQTVESLVDQARRLSLSVDLNNILHAQTILEMVLSRLDPLNVEAALLLKHVSRVAESESFPDERMHILLGKYWPVISAAVWLAFCIRHFTINPLIASTFLLISPVAVIASVVLFGLAVASVHEFGHAFGLYVNVRRFASTRDRIHFLKTFKHIDWGIKPLLGWRGLTKALRGDYQGISINVKALHRDWLSDASGVEDCASLREELTNTGAVDAL